MILVPVAAAWWTAAVAAVVTVGLLVVPAARAAVAAAAEGSTPRPRRFGPIQRSGLDVAVVGAAAFAYWQLRVLGDERAANLRGRFGVDPLVVLAPMFGIVAGGLIVLRVLPIIAGVAERLIGRRRGAIGALTVWQLARRPHRYTRTALLVTMSVAVGTFVAVYEPTWTGSQRAQAAHEVAADVRVEPNRRVGDSVGPLQLASVLAALGGDAVMATVELPTTLPGDLFNTGAVVPGVMRRVKLCSNGADVFEHLPGAIAHGNFFFATIDLQFRIATPVNNARLVFGDQFKFFTITECTFFCQAVQQESVEKTNGLGINTDVTERVDVETTYFDVLDASFSQRP